MRRSAVPFLAALLAACGSAADVITVTSPVAPAAPPAPVTVAISPSTFTLRVGQVRSIAATVQGTTNRAVRWSTSDDSVASVDGEGVVRAKGLGTAAIIATSLSDTTRSATSVVTTLPPVVLRLADTAVFLRRGGTRLLEATVTGTDSAGIRWSTSDSAVAMIGVDGTLRAVGIGTAQITAVAEADSSKRETVDVRVAAAAFRDSTIATFVPDVGGAALAVHLSGHRLLVRQASAIQPGEAARVATWRAPAGESLTVWGDAEGRPTRAVLGTVTLLFANYRGDSVDVAVVTADGVRIERAVRIPPHVQRPFERPRSSWLHAFGAGPRSMSAAASDWTLDDALAWGGRAVGVAACVASGVAVIAAPPTAPIFWISAAGCASTAVGIWNALAGEDNGALTESVGAVDLVTSLPGCLPVPTGAGCLLSIAQTLTVDTDRALAWVLQQNPTLGITLMLLQPRPAGEPGVSGGNVELDVFLGCDCPCGCSTRELDVGQARTYLARVLGTPDPSVTWTSSDTNAVRVTPLPRATGRDPVSLTAVGEAGLAASRADPSIEAAERARDGQPALVVVVGEGTATITARSVADPRQTKTFTIVGKPATSDWLGVTSVDNRIYPGGQLQLHGYGVGSERAGVAGYSSSSPGIASVSADGVVTGISEGSTSIIASAASGSGRTAWYTVYVHRRPTLAITASGAACQMEVAAYGRQMVLSSTMPQVRLQLPSSGVVALRQLPGSSGSCQYRADLDSAIGDGRFFLRDTAGWARSNVSATLSPGALAVVLVDDRGVVRF